MNSLVHEFHWTTSTSIERSFAALTKREALLTWFAEFVEVDARVGGHFRFWGRHTIETPSSSQATQVITRYEPPGVLAFTWRLLGSESTVLLSLEPIPGEDQTRISGRHTIDRIPTGARTKELIDDHWRFNGGNLLSYLNGGDGICRPDFNDANPEVKLSILINAPRAEVFKALITPELMRTWLNAANPQVDPQVGGEYSYGWSYEVDDRSVSGGPTRILEYVENEKLVTDWPDWRGDPAVPDQTITWLLHDEGSGTRVTIVHAGFTRTVDISDYPFGWKYFLDGLREMAQRC